MRFKLLTTVLTLAAIPALYARVKQWQLGHALPSAQVGRAGTATTVVRPEGAA